MWCFGSKDGTVRQFCTNKVAKLACSVCLLVLAQVLMAFVWLLVLTACHACVQGCVEIIYISVQITMYTLIVYWMCWFQRDAGQSPLALYCTINLLGLPPVCACMAAC